MIKVLCIWVFLSGISSWAEAQTKDTALTKEEEVIYPYYTIVVSSFSVVENAKNFASQVRTKGYEAYIRKSENGFYRICIYKLSTRADADARLEKMRHIDGLFQKAWVLGYDQLSENLSIEQI